MLLLPCSRIFVFYFISYSLSPLKFCLEKSDVTSKVHRGEIHWCSS